MNYPSFASMFTKDASQLSRIVSCPENFHERSHDAKLAGVRRTAVDGDYTLHTTQEALVRVPQPGRKELPITPNRCAHSENLPLSFAAPPPACDRDRSTGASVAVCALHTPLAVTPGTPALAMGTRLRHYGLFHYSELQLSCLCSAARGNEI